MDKGQNDRARSSVIPMKSTPPTLAREPTVHPRRSPPAQSVLPPESKRRKINHAPQVAAPANLHPNKSDSTDSSDQSATKWFDRANINVPRTDVALRNRDDEPPFFLGSHAKPYQQTFMSRGSEQMFGETGESRADSENGDLRGVIDDLTIENKRLRHILKNQHQPSDVSATSHDKLFEVRVHGLSAQRKHELEALLKNFAVKLQTPTASHSESSGGHRSQLIPRSNSSSSERVKGVSSQHADSGYGSQSNSGGTSSLKPTTASKPVAEPVRDNNVRNYLHDIPNALLPRRALVMSERAKMILVVRRLEQLFTGRKATPGDHAQPMQQQEVSNSAAHADRLEDVKNNRKRKAEGTREAHIIPYNSKVNLEGFERNDNSSPEKSIPASVRDTGMIDVHRIGSPDQRPTRPLDLDFHRAQIAIENLNYIRHLGLVPDSDGDGSQPSWVFLNLLMSMAQLHTINVTPDFVRRAIRKFSTKMEISKDGRKVKWKGGVEGTKFSYDDEKALEVEHNAALEGPDDAAGDAGYRSQSNSKSHGLASDSTSEEKMSAIPTSSGSKPAAPTPMSAGHMLVPEQSKSSSTFDYKPILFTGRRRHLPDLSYLDCSSSQESMSGDSNSLVHALSRSNLDRSQPPDEGIITFYSNPSYYSDLTGDRMPINFKFVRSAPDWELIGTHHEIDFDESPLRHHDACYFTPQFAQPAIHPGPIKDLEGFDFPPLSQAGQPETVPIDLPACGVGFVSPSDNFAVDVEVNRFPDSEKNAQQLKSTSRIISQGRTCKYGYGIENARTLRLQPSKLPMASYVLFASSSSSGPLNAEDDSDLSDSESSSSVSDSAAIPAFIRMLSAAEPGVESQDMDEDNDESSVDMLQIARAMDPAGVAAQEREYVINQPGGANAIAGSLAATVGASWSSPSASADGDAASDEEESASEMDTDD